MTAATKAGLGESHVVTARKDHRCDLCGYTIPKGDPHWTWTLAPGMNEFDEWWTGRTHIICDRIYRASEWFDPYEPMPDPGDFKAEILADVLWATSKVVAFR